MEIDERVVEVSRKFLPQTACGFSDSRVNLFFEDGLKFVRRKENEYDLILSLIHISLTEISVNGWECLVADG